MKFRSLLRKKRSALRKAQSLFLAGAFLLSRSPAALASDTAGGGNADAGRSRAVEEIVDFDRTLDSYRPRKKEYNFYFTYKNVHAWWDAVAMGIEEAQRQYLEKGIKITYDYLAPEVASSKDQEARLLAASAEGYDVIGVDVVDEEAISPVLDRLTDQGLKIMTFSSSDAASGCKRIAYVGNTHNYEDGQLITEELCKKLKFSGKVAILVGNRNSPCHEVRAKGAKDVLSKYPDMELVAVEYDKENATNARGLVKGMLSEYQDLAGIICCNMNAPVGAARAAVEYGRNIVIVGMDHDKEALHYLKSGAIYCLGVQDCYSIGFDTLQVAIKIADGRKPGEYYPETTEEKTGIVFQEDAEYMLRMLYGEI